MKWSLRKKIFVGYGFTLALMVVILIWAFLNLWSLGRASDAILRENYRSILAAENMVYSLERQDSAVLLLFLGFEEEGWKQFRDNEGQFFQWLGRARDNITIEGEGKIVAAIETGYSAYLNRVSAIKPISRTGTGTAAMLYHENLLPAFLQVRQDCIHLREINQENMYQVSEHAALVSRRAVWSMGIIGIAAVGIGMGFSLFLSNLLARPVQQMLQATRKISEGDYDIEVSARTSDEIGLLTRQFNSMAQKLKAFHDLNIEEIVAEKRKSESVIRSIDDGIVLIDAGCQVTAVNPMAASILQTAPGRAEKRHLLEVVNHPELFHYIKRSIESGQPPPLEEKDRVLTVEGRGGKRYFQFSITPVHSRTGPLSGVILVLRDITRLTELDRLKSEFVMTASHELRTPLTSIGMGIELLLESAPPRLNDKERRLLSVVHEDLLRLKLLVNNLLDLSRIEAGKMQLEISDCPVLPLLERAVESFKIQAEQKGVEISFQSPENLLALKADGSKITLVLANLISNSLHFTPQGGHIGLRAEKSDPFIEISVLDDGPGIPYEYQSKVFDKFVQVKSEKILGGSGLGLAICKEIIHLHGGTIWVDSVPGAGSTFHFTIPAAL